MTGPLLRALDRHWFAPASLSELALVRIVVVFTQLVYFFPPLRHGLRQAAANAETFSPLPALKVLMLPFGGWGARPDRDLLIAVSIFAAVAGLLALIGLFTRLSMLGFAAAVTLLQAHLYSYGEFHHPEGLMIIALWVLALGPIGGAYSVDSLIRRLRAARRSRRFRPYCRDDDLDVFARWPLRVIQWLFVLVYLSAGMSKLVNGGLAWFNGYTLSYFLLQDGVRGRIPLAIQLHDHIPLMQAAAIGTGIFELTFAMAILVPGLAWVYVVGGTLMHVGIFHTMRAPFFQYIALYLVFAESLRAVLPAWVRARRRAPEPAWTVIYDGLCPLCVRGMVLLDTLDLRRRLAYVDLERPPRPAAVLAPVAPPASARHTMHVVAPDGRVFHGFFALRALARTLPPLWPLLPLFHAPFADRVGKELHRAVAAVRRGPLCRADTSIA